MVVSAAHFKEVTNGYEQRSDGLYVHLGKMDVGSLRVTNNLPPRSGVGVETLYDAPGQIGYILAYDRDAAAYRDLNINARNITLNTIGKVNLPASTAQQNLGSYRQIVGWTITATGAWYESPLQVAATPAGGRVRVEACGSLQSGSSANQIIYMGVGIDGAISLDSLGATQFPVANSLQGFCVVGYITPSAAPHRIALFLYTDKTGGGGLWSGCYQQMWLHEQKA